ncbi:MAG: hypothetical protein VW548_05635, partial [Methylotenera sp.]
MKSPYKKLTLALISSGIVLMSATHAYADGSLLGLNDLPGNLPANIGAVGIALSDDGTVMVGAVRLDAYNFRAYSFSSAGKVELAQPENARYTYAQDVSANGSTIVGW